MVPRLVSKVSGCTSTPRVAASRGAQQPGVRRHRQHGRALRGGGTGAAGRGARTDVFLLELAGLVALHKGGLARATVANKHQLRVVVPRQTHTDTQPRARAASAPPTRAAPRPASALGGHTHLELGLRSLRLLDKAAPHRVAAPPPVSHGPCNGLAAPPQQHACALRPRAPLALRCPAAPPRGDKNRAGRMLQRPAACAGVAAPQRATPPRGLTHPACWCAPIGGHPRLLPACHPRPCTPALRCTAARTPGPLPIDVA